NTQEALAQQNAGMYLMPENADASRSADALRNIYESAGIAVDFDSVVVRDNHTIELRASFPAVNGLPGKTYLIHMNNANLRETLVKRYGEAAEALFEAYGFAKVNVPSSGEVSAAVRSANDRRRDTVADQPEAEPSITYLTPSHSHHLDTKSDF